MKIRDLIEGLKHKDQNAEVQFIVTQKADGAVVAMDLQGRNIDLGKLVAFFGSPRPTPTQNLHDALLAHWHAMQSLIETAVDSTPEALRAHPLSEAYNAAEANVRAALAAQRVGV